MSALSLLFKAADIALGVVEQASGVYERARKLWKGQPPPAPSNPLSYRDVQHQQDQIRSATTKKP